MSAVAAAAMRTCRRRLMAVVRCAIALAILAWLFHKVSPASVLDAAASAAPAALLGAFLFALLAHCAKRCASRGTCPWRSWPRCSRSAS